MILYTYFREIRLEMNIAVFADLHGRLRLCFKLCARWQRETGKEIDLILQAGDLGAYPDISRLDRATIKHMREDPTELGFSHDFVQVNDAVAHDLSETTCPLVFVRGNHEDHEWLDELEKQHSDPVFPIDAYQRVFCLKTGLPYTFKKDDTAITVLGVGRIGPLPGEPDETKPKYIQSYELDRLYADGSLVCDVLLTHDVALDFLATNEGMEEIRLILDAHKPAYHFHGHTEEPFMRRRDPNEKTITIKMSDLHWDRSTRQLALEQGSMGILRWNGPEDHDFSVVDADWFTDYNAKSWLEML